jgi:hypothetical protein
LKEPLRSLVYASLQVLSFLTLKLLFLQRFSIWFLRDLKNHRDVHSVENPTFDSNGRGSRRDRSHKCMGEYQVAVIGALPIFSILLLLKLTFQAHVNVELPHAFPFLQYAFYALLTFSSFLPPTVSSVLLFVGPSLSCLSTILYLGLPSVVSHMLIASCRIPLSMLPFDFGAPISRDELRCDQHLSCQVVSI